MAKKYLDKAGVQVLWNKVKEQIANSSGGSGSSNVKIIQVSGSFVEESETEAYINLSESTFTQIESHDKAKALVLYFTTYATYAYCIYFKNAQSNNCFLVYKEANYNANLSGFMTGYITSVDKKFHFNKIGMANATGTISEDKGTPSVIIDVDSGRDGYNYFTFNFKNLSNTKIYEISGDIVDGKIVISNEIWTDLLGYTRKYPTVIYFPDAECYAYPLRVNGGDFLNAYITYNTETKVISRGVFGDGYFVFYPLGEVDLSNYYNKTEIEEKLGEKQQKLVSGTNIKTINNQNILGSGNINIESGSSFEIPTITLTPTNDDPISGTLSDEDYTTIQNNNIIKFVVPNKVDAIVSKQVVQDMSFFFFLIGHTIYNLLIESNKSFSISQTQLPLGTRITGNNLGIYDDAGNLMGGTVSKTQMQEWLEIGGGGTSGGFEIPKITLIPTSMDPVSGTFTDEEVQIIQNNDVIKFEIPGFAAGTATKISNLSSGSIGFAWVVGGSITYWFEIVGKEYTTHNYTLLIKDEFPIPQSLTVAANKIYLQISGGKTLGSGISAEQIINMVGKPYIISEDPEDSDTLLITENW